MRVLLLLLCLISFSRGCLQVNRVSTTTSKPCQCQAYTLDDTNIRDHVKPGHSFYIFLSIYTFRAPMMDIEDCSLRMYCDVGFHLQLFDNTSQGKGFGEYEAEGICNPTNQKWLVDTRDRPELTEFNILYGTCFASPTTTTRTTPTRTTVTTPSTTTVPTENCSCTSLLLNSSVMPSYVDYEDIFYLDLTANTTKTPGRNVTGCLGTFYCDPGYQLLIFDDTGLGITFPTFTNAQCDSTTKKWNLDTGSRDGSIVFNQIFALCMEGDEESTSSSTVTKPTTPTPSTTATTPINTMTTPTVETKPTIPTTQGAPTTTVTEAPTTETTRLNSTTSAITPTKTTTAAATSTPATITTQSITASMTSTVDSTKPRTTLTSTTATAPSTTASTVGTTAASTNTKASTSGSSSTTKSTPTKVITHMSTARTESAVTSPTTIKATSPSTVVTPTTTPVTTKPTTITTQSTTLNFTSTVLPTTQNATSATTTTTSKASTTLVTTPANTVTTSSTSSTPMPTTTIPTTTSTTPTTSTTTTPTTTTTTPTTTTKTTTRTTPTTTKTTTRTTTTKKPTTTTKDPTACLPNTPTTFVLALSGDTGSSLVAYHMFLNMFGHNYSPFTRFAVMYFDGAMTTKYFVYSTDKAGFVNSVKDVMAAASAVKSLKAASVGTNFLTAMENFLTNTQVPVCGAQVVMYAKRWPNEASAASLIQKLRKWHITVDVFANNITTGGRYLKTLNDLAVQTNGMFTWNTDSSWTNVYYSIISYIRPSLVYVESRVVRGNGQVTMKQFNAPADAEYFFIATVHNDAIRATLRSYKITWSTKTSSDNFVVNVPQVNRDFGGGNYVHFSSTIKKGLYNMTINHGYSDNTVQTLLFRIYVKQATNYWMPY